MSEGKAGGSSTVDLMKHVENYFFRYRDSLSMALDEWAGRYCARFADEQSEFNLEHTRLHKEVRGRSLGWIRGLGVHGEKRASCCCRVAPHARTHTLASTRAPTTHSAPPLCLTPLDYVHTTPHTASYPRPARARCGQFCDLFESLLETEISSVGFTVSDLYQALQDDELRGAQRTTFAQVLNAVIDFPTFSRMMADKNIGIDLGLSEAFAYPTDFKPSVPEDAPPASTQQGNGNGNGNSNGNGNGNDSDEEEGCVDGKSGEGAAGRADHTTDQAFSGK